MSVRGLQSLRISTVEAIREHSAILLLLDQVTPEKRREIEELQLGVRATTDRSRLRGLLNETLGEIVALRRSCDVTASREELMELLEDAESAPPGQAMFLPQFRLEQLMPGISKMSPDKFPLHALIELDYGKNRSHPRREVHILEASLFEDLCALFNQAHELNRTRPPTPYEDKQSAKTADALNRATVTTAFYLVECYMNGIASDHVITAGTKLQPKELETLTEWNEAKQARRYVRFRDKLIQYPRIIAGLEHPPLQENNCPELRFVIQTAKELRDSIVHASAQPDRESGMDKWSRFNNITFAEVEHTVDQVIKLIRLIELTIRGNVDMLSWMQDRTSDGKFSASVFD